MLREVGQLRINVQTLDLSTERDPLIRTLLVQVREDIEQIESIGAVVLQFEGREDWFDSFLDLRSLGLVADLQQVTEIDVRFRKCWSSASTGFKANIAAPWM
jgi:hypothetical protein